MIPLALFAKIELAPAGVLKDPAIHELAHEFLRARLLAEHRAGLLRSSRGL